MKTILINKWAVAIFRVMLSLIFIIAGLNHLLQTQKVAQRLEGTSRSTVFTSFADPELLVLLAGIGLLVGGIALMAGFRTRLAAAGLILILLPITISVQLEGAETLGPLFKNIGLFGGLIFFTVHGHISYGLDEVIACPVHQFLIKKNKNKMKLGFNKIIIIILIFLAAPGFLQAQEKKSQIVETEAGKDNFAILVRNSEHIKAAVKTAKQLKTHEGFTVGKIEVVICGKEVTELKVDSELTATIQEGIAEGMVFSVCGMSLEKFGVKSSELIQGVNVVQNGFIRGFELQKAGYLILEL